MPTFFQNRAIGVRKEYGGEHDLYTTPPIVTHVLIKYLEDKGLVAPNRRRPYIWEPACGLGHISKTLRGLGYKVKSTDLQYLGYGAGGIDFLTCSRSACDWVITNPPFKLAREFILRAFDLKVPFAFLLKSTFWHSKKSCELFQFRRPRFVLPMTFRHNPFTHRKGYENFCSTMDHQWVVWDTAARYTHFDLLEKP